MLFGEGTPEYVNMAGVIGSLGFAVWYGWYVTANLMPKINESHRQTVDAMLATFKEEQREERQNYRESLELITTRFSCGWRPPVQIDPKKG